MSAPSDASSSSRSQERGDHAMSIDAAVGWREGNQNGLHG